MAAKGGFWGVPCFGRTGYFVGCEEWGFSVWAHNACTNKEVAEKGPKEFVDPQFVGPARFKVVRGTKLGAEVTDRLRAIESGTADVLHPKHDQQPYKNKLYKDSSGQVTERALLPQGGDYYEYYVSGKTGDQRRLIVDRSSSMVYYSPDHHQNMVAVDSPWSR